MQSLRKLLRLLYVAFFTSIIGLIGVAIYVALVVLTHQWWFYELSICVIVSIYLTKQIIKLSKFLYKSVDMSTKRSTIKTQDSGKVSDLEIELAS